MNAELTDAQKMRRLPWLIAQGTTSSVFVALTVFGSVFMLFLDELGIPKAKIGILISLIPFCGPISLFVAPWVARRGYKRTFVTFWFIRNCLITCLLLLLPWIVRRFGVDWAFRFVGMILLLFAVCRAIAETGVYPWSQTIVPPNVRGRFAAISGMISTPVKLATVAFATYVIAHGVGVGRYLTLMTVGVVFGFISVGCAALVPGGEPRRDGGPPGAHFGRMGRALRDRDFALYLGVVTFISLGGSSLSFMALYLKDEIGLQPAQVISLDTANIVASFLCAYLLGHLADRIGGKPLMLCGLSYMTIAPLFYCLMPAHSGWSYPLGMGLVFVRAIAGSAWGIGCDKQFYVHIVPMEKRTEYMAVYYAWMGILGGAGPLTAGMLIQRLKGLSGQWLGLTLNPYVPLFGMGIVLYGLGFLLLSRLRARRSAACPP